VIDATLVDGKEGAVIVFQTIRTAPDPPAPPAPNPAPPAPTLIVNFCPGVTLMIP
jgi:hypothetical protein